MSELRVNKIIPKDGLSSDSWGGGIVQISYGSYDGSALSITSQTDIVSATITPKSSSSKILVDVRLRAQLDGSSGQWYAGVKRVISGGSAVWISGQGDNSNGGNSNGQFAWHMLSSDHRHGGCFQFCRDLPATTAQCTYTLAAGPWGSANGALRVNRQQGDQEKQGGQIVLYEVSA